MVKKFLSIMVASLLFLGCNTVNEDYLNESNQITVWYNLLFLVNEKDSDLKVFLINEPKDLCIEDKTYTTYHYPQYKSLEISTGGYINIEYIDDLYFYIVPNGNYENINNIKDSSVLTKAFKDFNFSDEYGMNHSVYINMGVPDDLIKKYYFYLRPDIDIKNVKIN